MSDGNVQHDPVILHDYDDVADMGSRQDVEGDRQDAMVAHNKEAKLALTYTFRAGECVPLPGSKDVAPVLPGGGDTDSLPTAEREFDATIPLIEYRSRYQEQFGQSVDDAVVILMTEFEIAEPFESDFRGAITSCAQNFRLQSARAALPPAPERDYMPGEGILNYLRSPHGFAKWIAAGEGVLTRPVIRELAPKGYVALANWLRSNELPDDLPIPTKSEALDAEIANPVSVREARRIARRGDRRPPRASSTSKW